MIKNIPNAFVSGVQVTCSFTRDAMLEIINKTCNNLYDFFYLPIDQKTSCNLGYGYINMIDIPSVIKFYSEVLLIHGSDLQFHGKKWPNTRSVKVCSICYGRLQSGSVASIDFDLHIGRTSTVLQ